MKFTQQFYHHHHIIVSYAREHSITSPKSLINLTHKLGLGEEGHS